MGSSISKGGKDIIPSEPAKTEDKLVEFSIPNPTLKEIFAKFPFIKIPPELIKSLGKTSTGESQWCLELEKRYNIPAIIIFTIPNCIFCVKLGAVLADAQIKLAQKREPFFVFFLEVSDEDEYTKILARELGVTQYPALFCADKRGRLYPMIPKFMEYSEEDPNGNLRLNIDILERIFQTMMATKSKLTIRET